MMRLLAIAGVVLSLPVLGGCARSEQANVDRTMRNAGESVREAATNAALAAKVKSALATRKGLNGADINIDARGSTVTLKGDVNTREQADLAEQVARQTDGVSAVNNQLMLRVPVKGSAGTASSPH